MSSQERRKSCPCEFGNACSKNCTCADGLRSGGCRRCCRYGSLSQQETTAKIIIAKEIKNRADLFRKAIKAIATVDDNLPDGQAIFIDSLSEKDIEEGMEAALSFFLSKLVTPNTTEADVKTEHQKNKICNKKSED